MAFSAQEIATEELGPRHQLDVRRAHTREVTRERFTSLDRELERRMQDDRVRVGVEARQLALESPAGP